jgi:hypothetical protein
MSKELWALAGVVVGAILGALAQVVNEWLKAKRESKTRLRDERRAAYVALLDANDRTLTSALAAEVWLGSLPDEERKASLDKYRQPVLAALTEGHAALSALWLIAPRDTYDAATAMHYAAHDIGEKAATPGEPDGSHTWQDRKDEFVNLARRDLGTPDV